MPALIPTDFTAAVTWLGLVPDRADSVRATPQDHIFAGFDGVTGDDHNGLTRPSCSRMSGQYPVGTTIRNTRQFSILSVEELEIVAKNMGVDRVEPEWIGASIVIRGVPDLSHVPPGSRLQFASGATMVVNLENGPCHLPAKVIDADAPGKGGAFKAAAKGLRGVTGWVEREGDLRLGDTLRLFVPSQKPWKHS